MLSTVLGLVIVAIFIGLIGGLFLWVLSNLGMGLTVDGFGSAFLGAIAIAVVSTVVVGLLGMFGLTVNGAGLISAIVNLVISAIVLLIADTFVAGMKVNGFSGAITGAIGFGLLGWLSNWVLGLIF
ncbi:phage holin family protein [Candidatus Chloroploca sp. Khr17]|uniref:phage holin family protein n=1 Tax=Candidatus Chloroploca sp. Khr17 TaxID=2496869 RepID=UPI00101C8DB5|nr:phage holin family protein [Candidatus Chloroploca sp. Khr17]